MIYPESVGLVEHKLVDPDGKVAVVHLQVTLHIPQMPLNIFSGEKLYRAGGFVNKNLIYNPASVAITTIDVARRGFLMHVAGYPEPVTGNALMARPKPRSVKWDLPRFERILPDDLEGQVGGRAFPLGTSDNLIKSRLWHRRLAHVHCTGLKRTIRTTKGADIAPAKIAKRPYKAYNLGRNL